MACMCVTRHYRLGPASQHTNLVWHLDHAAGQHQGCLHYGFCLCHQLPAEQSSSLTRAWVQTGMQGFLQSRCCFHCPNHHCAAGQARPAVHPAVLQAGVAAVRVWQLEFHWLEAPAVCWTHWDLSCCGLAAVAGEQTALMCVLAVGRHPCHVKVYLSSSAGPCATATSVQSRPAVPVMPGGLS